EHFEQELEDAGGRVDSVNAYQTCSDDRHLAQIKALLAGGGIDCVSFTKPLAISEFAELCDTDDLARLLAGVTIAGRDEATRALAIEFGLAGTLRPLEPSVRALVNLIQALGN
ncbi:MAG: hypothetical protein DMF73_09395, partial [Acidobacteria bacterium]